MATKKAGKERTKPSKASGLPKKPAGRRASGKTADQSARKDMTAKSAAADRAGAAVQESASARPGGALFSSWEGVGQGLAGKGKKFWLQVVIVAMVVLVSVEVTLILKGKIEVQGKLQQLRVIGQRGGPPEQPGQFWGPGQIRVHNPSGRVCLVDGNFNKVLVWNKNDGSHIIDLDKQGKHEVAPDGQAQTKDFLPTDAAFDGEGNLYVTQKNRSEVAMFSPTYKLLRVWQVPAPWGIAADDKGNVYVGDGSTGNIISFDAEGKEQSRFGGEALQNPGFMDCDADGNLYVANRGAGQISIFSPRGKLLRAWKPRFQPFGNPDVDVEGKLVYLCEHDNQRVFVYTLEGKLMRDLAVSYPAVMAADAEGLIYVSGGYGIHQYQIVKGNP
ncbi:NHL repeat-containing protein [candidate division FCPU426 bacterium]|nr:NHL repeat-containing protein [candidate division FCPU426 bacterium]